MKLSPETTASGRRRSSVWTSLISSARSEWKCPEQARFIAHFVQVKLFPECEMDTEDVVLNECKGVEGNKTLKKCEKRSRPKVHSKKVYKCENVTKQHCTTLWTLNQWGEKVWGGTDDCRNVTWEECDEVVKNVTLMVPRMSCLEEDLPYLDYRVEPRNETARRTECEVRAEQVCLPVTTRKCGSVRYKVCNEVT